MNRSPRRRNSIYEQYDCSDYKEPNECNLNIDCFYDYDEKECRRKRSPTTFNRSPYYNVSPDLPISNLKNIHSYLYEGNVRLIDLYPHNPREILNRIQKYPKKNIYVEEIVELINYLPNDADTFSITIFNTLKRKYNQTELSKIIGKAGNIIFLSYLQLYEFNTYNQVMISAAEEGHRDLVERMIELGATDFNTTMAWAARGGHMDIIERMIELGATNFNNAMYHAAIGGHRDIVELLIQAGADNFNMPMYGAAGGGHRDIIEWMIQLGATNFNVAMELATEGGHTDIVELLKRRRFE